MRLWFLETRAQLRWFEGHGKILPGQNRRWVSHGVVPLSDLLGAPDKGGYPAQSLAVKQESVTVLPRPAFQEPESQLRAP